MANRRLIVGVSGASGAPVTIELLQQLQTEKDLEVHLICSKWGLATLEHEAGVTRQDLEGLCTRESGRRGFWFLPPFSDPLSLSLQSKHTQMQGIKLFRKTNKEDADNASITPMTHFATACTMVRVVFTAACAV